MIFLNGYLRGAAFALCVWAVGLAAADLRAEDGPDWWRTRGVVRDGAVPNDFAALNAGQLKHLAHMAWEELDTLPGGAGFVPAFTNAGNNYAAVNVGQLKEIARPFFDRMMEASGHYPWTGTVSSNDYAIANIGQAKYLFSFDPQSADFDQDGLPDAWEVTHGFNPYDASDAASDADGDGLSNLDEFLLRTDPRNGVAGAPGATPVSRPVYGPGVTGLLILTPSAVRY